MCHRADHEEVVVGGGKKKKNPRRSSLKSRGVSCDGALVRHSHFAWSVLFVNDSGVKQGGREAVGAKVAARDDGGDGGMYRSYKMKKAATKDGDKEPPCGQDPSFAESAGKSRSPRHAPRRRQRATVGTACSNGRLPSRRLLSMHFNALARPFD